MLCGIDAQPTYQLNELLRQEFCDSNVLCSMREAAQDSVSHDSIKSLDSKESLSTSGEPQGCQFQESRVGLTE